MNTQCENYNNTQISAIEKCGKLASQTSILDNVEQELRRQGFTGSADLPKLVFLCLNTRLFRRPVSLVIKGPSGSGKSFALGAGLQFLPDGAYEEFSGMSEKALIYHEGLNLKHKYLVIGEAAGLAEGNGRAFLRQLLSEGRIRYATVESTSNGIAAKNLKPIEGPTGLLMTTTANALHPEDESRMLSYHLDESPERIQEVLLQQAIGNQAMKVPLESEPWFALQDFIEAGEKRVQLPFARELAKHLPNTHFRVMRDFPQVLALIQAHALLHQCTRERDETGAIIATIDDYSAVHTLINDSLSQGLEEAVPTSIREIVEKVRELQSPEPTCPWERIGVTQTQLADALKRDQSVISRNARKAVGQGFLIDLSPGQGRKAMLILGDRVLPAGTVLPAPDEISHPQATM